MVVALTITKYRMAAIPFAFLGMAVLRLPLWLNKKCRFWKLMGSGKNASVDQAPDFKHWAILTTWDTLQDCNNFNNKSFVVKWFKVFGIESFSILLNPLSSHGRWSGEQPFKPAEDTNKLIGPIAVITRAGINWDKISDFRKNIKRASSAMAVAPGFIMSAGLGELPYIMQATFSVWENVDHMKNYAYKNHDHADVIKLTRERKWYSEELFARFQIINCEGTLNGKHFNHLNNKTIL